MEENLGKKAKDKITGFSGTITAFAKYLYESDRYCIEPVSYDTATGGDAKWIVAERVEILAEA